MAQDGRAEPLKIAWLERSDLRPYRWPLFEHLARTPDLDITVFHGRGRAGLGEPSAAVGPADVHRVVLRSVYLPGQTGRIVWHRGIRRMVRGDYDLVVLPEIVHDLGIWAVAVWAWASRKPIVLSGYGFRPRYVTPTVLSPLRDLARRLLIGLADGYVSYTRRGKQGLVSLGADPAAVHVAHNTLDVDALGERRRGLEEKKRRALEWRLQLGERPTLIFMGRLVRAKHTDTLIRACSELARMDEPVNLIVIGDGPERAELEKQAAAAATVHYEGAIYDDNELAYYFDLAQLLVIPGRVGLACVYGFAFGLPVVTTSDGVVEQSPEYEYLRDGENACVVESLSHERYAQILRELVGDRDRLERLSAGAARSARQLSIQVMVDEIRDAIRQTAGR